MARASKRHRLIKIDWPEFGVAACPPPSSLSEFEARIAALRARMEERKLTHTIVYADREHFANLAYLTGFDPRFEEALLIVGLKASPLILVGNECEAYLGISPLHASGQMRQERFQLFSLLDQPRERSRSLREILAEEGVSHPLPRRRGGIQILLAGRMCRRRPCLGCPVLYRGHVARAGRSPKCYE